jgi:hypothetical protein
MTEIRFTLKFVELEILKFLLHEPKFFLTENHDEKWVCFSYLMFYIHETKNSPFYINLYVDEWPISHKNFISNCSSNFEIFLNSRITPEKQVRRITPP